MSDPKTTTFQIGDQVEVFFDGGWEGSTRGVVVNLDSLPSYIGVRFNGESTWYEWAIETVKPGR